MCRVYNLLLLFYRFDYAVSKIYNNYSKIQGGSAVKNVFTMKNILAALLAGFGVMFIMITTPNGHDLFHKIYTDSQLGLNNFKTYKVIWSAHPNRDEKWKKETIDAIGYKKFRVVHECEFEGSAATAISADVIAKLHFKNPISTSYLSEDNPECVYKIYESSQPGAQYWMQVDPGEGVGNDFTTI